MTNTINELKRLRNKLYKGKQTKVADRLQQLIDDLEKEYDEVMGVISAIAGGLSYDSAMKTTFSGSTNDIDELRELCDALLFEGCEVTQQVSALIEEYVQDSVHGKILYRLTVAGEAFFVAKDYQSGYLFIENAEKYYFLCAKENYRKPEVILKYIQKEMKKHLTSSLSTLNEEMRN